MNNWRNIIQNKLLPPTCILCRQPGFEDLDLCLDCFADLPRNQYCCYRCAENFETASHSSLLCGRCLSKSPDFDETHAPFLYASTVSYLIGQLKFNNQYKNARLLGSLLAKQIDLSAERPECLMPIPLHISRYRQRGFNQALEISRHIAKQLEIPLDFHSCQRNRDTNHQTGLSAKERQKNMVKAFSVKEPLSFQHVAIIDDVMTTGATASAMAAALKQSGVSRVDVWVCARA